MSQRNWSVLLGSAIVVLVSTTSLPPQPPVGSNPPTQEINQDVAFRRIPGPFGGRYGGRRDDEIFAIAPNEVEGMNVLWRDRPIFIWEGSISRVELSDEESDELLWSQAVSPEDRRVAYTGAALQPGQVYEWILGDRFGVSVDLVTFQVMEAAQRDQITMELAELAAAAEAEGATAEEIALQRANYFADRQLWVEVLQEAFAVEDPSTELATLLQEVPNGFLQASA